MVFRHSAQDVPAHDVNESRDLVLRDARGRVHFSDGTVEGNLSDITLGFHRGYPFLERRIGGIGDAALYCSIGLPSRASASASFVRRDARRPA